VRSGTTLHVRGIRIDLGGALVLVGLLGWMLFYFVDYRWYHRLLVGSVKHGKLIEGILEEGVTIESYSATVEALENALIADLREHLMLGAIDETQAEMVYYRILWVRFAQQFAGVVIYAEENRHT